nr:hypothetical protein BaRGS_016425 [Batillaria attramentaria]
MPNSSEDPVVAHKDYFLTDAQRALAETIQEPLKLVLVAIAIPLALCNVIVFSQKSMRSASACYIIGLNCGQLVYVVSHTVLYTWHQFVDPPYSQFSYCQYLRYVSLYGGVLIGKRGSYIVLVVASIERLYAVLRPLHIRNFFLARRPVLTVMVIYALAAVLHAYQFARSKMVMVTHPVTGISVCNLVKTDLYQRHQHVNDFFSLFAKAIFSYASLALQLVLNILTVWALRRHNMASKHVTSSANEDAKRQQERQLTVTLLGASISYLILSLPEKKRKKKDKDVLLST